jgi:hypothetical protein
MLLALDPFENVVLVGSAVGGTVDLGAGLIPSNSLFAAQLGSNGSVGWSTSWTIPGAAYVDSVATGPAGEIAFSGYYQYNAPDFGGSALAAAPKGAAYVVKLTGGGMFVFDASSGPDGAATYPIGKGVAVNASGDVYMVGGYAGSIDFGGATLTTGAAQSAFFAKFGPTGTLSLVRTYGTTGAAFGNAMGLDASGAPYIAGVYGEATTIDLGSGALPASTSTNESAVFLGRLAP